MVLTDKQKHELDCAIIEYLQQYKEQFPGTLDCFVRQSSINEIPASNKGLLEKKWTSVQRLQQRITSLEDQIKQKDEELRSGSNSNQAILKDARLLPRTPAKHTLSGHRGGITCVLSHPRYSIVVSASEDATIKIWDYETGAFEQTLRGHTNTVNFITFDKSGNMLASCSSDLTVRLWDFTTFACLKTLRGHDHTVSCVRFVPSSDHVISCSRDDTIKIWETTTGYCVSTLSGNHTDWIRCISISPDGLFLASGGNDQNIVIWNLNTKNEVGLLKGHDHVIETINFAENSSDILLPTSLIKKGNNKEDESKGGNQSQFENTYFIVSAGRDRTVRLWNVITSECLIVFADHENWVRSAFFHPSGKYIISSSDDRTIRVLDIQNERCLRTLTSAHSHFISSVSMSLIGSSPVIISGGVDQVLKVWECK